MSLSGPQLVGRTIGNYVITARLGAGGMGEVFRAEHPRIARHAAIKLLRPQMCVDHGLVERFFDEARAANLIRHPGIIEIFDSGFFEGRAYLIMELLDGESLSQWLRGLGPSSADVATIVEIGSQIAAALEAAHFHGIVHRDLKPDNIFLTPPEPPAVGGPRVKILDFGVAKLLVEPSPSRTDSGMMLGTPIYMSPEQCSGSRQVDHRADIYALGCILFELACRRPPFVMPGAGDLLTAHLTAAPPDPRGLRRDLPDWLADLILQMLAKLPEQRPLRMVEVEQRLRAGPRAARPTGSAPNASTPWTREGISGATRPARTRVSRWLIVGPLLVVASAGIAAAVRHRRPEPAPAPRFVEASAPVSAPPVDAAPGPPDTTAPPAIEPRAQAPRPEPRARPARRPPRHRSPEKPFSGFDDL